MKCDGLHCPGCKSRSGPPAAIIAGLVILALIAAKARAIGHAASTALHIAIVAVIALAFAAIPAIVAIVAIRRHRARRRAVAALAAVQTCREIPQAHIRALPQATAPPAHPAGCDCLPCLTRPGPRPTTEPSDRPAALVSVRPKWPYVPGWTSRNGA
jgi:hypothetical protein